MKSLFDKSSRESLIQRMQKLDAQTPPKWGKSIPGRCSHICPILCAIRSGQA
ncbi:MAG: hypothetical protein IPG76_05150 [Acidobacteria bacterium]|nr:hypothetical protein [Acidobacteriota bacterium]